MSLTGRHVFRIQRGGVAAEKHNFVPDKRVAYGIVYALGIVFGGFDVALKVHAITFGGIGVQGVVFI